MRILFASSGSGGHLFPALSLAKKLKQDNFDIHFIIDKKCSENRIRESGFAVERLSVTKFDFSSFKLFFKTLINLNRSFLESISILKIIKPAAVVGFGGYASFPILLAANLRGIPVIIHEQNVIPGRANRILSLFAKRIAVSFKESNKYFNQKKVITTGCPTREELLEAKKEAVFREFNFAAQKFTILVMGGSQGSHRINEALVGAIIKIKDLSQFQIIHITGENDFDFVKGAYQKNGAKAYCVAFLKEIGYAYSIADLAISRAGGSSLAEIANFRVPSILIPYPFAYNHQKANAAVFRDCGGAIIIEDKDLSADKLKELILEFLNNRGRLREMKDSLNKIAIPDAADNLAQVVLSLVKNE